MPYARLNKSGCLIHHNRLKLRVDVYLKPDEPYYEQFGRAYVVDVTSEKYKAGYPGERDAEGHIVDVEDYRAWRDSLPCIWQDKPIHSHFIHPDPDATDQDIKDDIQRTLDYFHTFHVYCWQNTKPFIDEWKKVPKRTGDVRCPVERGKPEEVANHQTKLADVSSRLQDFDVGEKAYVPELNIGDKGTIDVGSAAENRSSSVAIAADGNSYTDIDYNNAANEAGALDTVEIYCNAADAGHTAYAGTFIDNGSGNFTCNDAETLGELSVGYNECTGLDIDIEIGEFIGCSAIGPSYEDVQVDKANSGGSGVYTVAYYNRCVPDSNDDYTLQADDILSLYGTGTGAPTEYEVAVTDAIEVGELTTESMVAGVSVIDGIDGGDTAGEAQESAHTVIEGVDVGEILSQLMTAEVSATDVVEGSDLASILSQIIALDGLEMSDTATELMSAELSVLDGVTLSDDTLLSFLASLEVTEGVIISDTAIIAAVVNLLVSDGVTLSDTPIFNIAYYLLLSGAFDIGDATQLLNTTDNQVTEGVDVGDTPAAEMSGNIYISEGVVISDNSPLSMLATMLVSEGVTLGDATFRGLLYSVSVTEGITLGDTVAKSLLANLETSEGISLGDVPLNAMTAELTASEGLIVSDLVTAQMLAVLSTLDGVKVSDTPLAICNLIISEGFTLGDIIALSMLASITLTDGVKLSDVITKAVIMGVQKAFLTYVYDILTQDSDLQDLMGGTVRVYVGKAEPDAEMPYLVHRLDIRRSGAIFPMRNASYTLDIWSNSSNAQETINIRKRVYTLLDEINSGTPALGLLRIWSQAETFVPETTQNLWHYYSLFNVRFYRIIETANIIARG